MQILHKSLFLCKGNKKLYKSVGFLIFFVSLHQKNR